MKKLIVSCLILVAFAAFGFNNFAYAEKQPYEVENPCELANQENNPLCASYGRNNEKELIKTVKNVLQTVYFWTGIITVIFIIIGGIRYTTSQGDPGKTKKAKDTITYAIVGLVVALSAFGITEFTLSAISGKTSGELIAESEQQATEEEANGETQIKSLKVVSKTTILEQETLQLKVEIYPDYAENRNLSFTSSDTSIATVSATGLV